MTRHYHPALSTHPEQQYLDLLRDALDNGVERGDRTGTGTLGLFGRQIRFDLSKGFPLLTTKRVHFHSIVVELLWFLRGETNVRYLRENDCTIWDEWANENGDLGPVYGKQWRSWEHHRLFDGPNGTKGLEGGTTDQIRNVVQAIITNPNSRRHIVSAWNPADVDDMALPPCHCLFQFFVADGKLSCQLYQRSADLFLGVPFNIASYALLTHMVAQATGLEVGEFVHTFGDAHLYLNHVEQAELQLSREPRPFPTLTINPERRSLDLHKMSNWTPADFTLTDYNPHPGIKAKVAV